MDRVLHRSSGERPLFGDRCSSFSFHTQTPKHLSRTNQRILLVLDNFSSHVCEYTRRRAHQLGIDLVFLPVGSPDLNPIEQVWKSLKWKASPLIVESAAEYRALLTELFEQLTTQLSFAASWIDKYLGGYLQKLR
ncbi:transposase [Halobellus sp. Atlit-38R]|uniref:transposase n=1 Tax=Halobellus sp. Atlit-38R TaxID=2282131 RepID=UPI001F308008|nr:transposase [Halobellus sp. Atlit-38R]